MTFSRFVVPVQAVNYGMDLLQLHLLVVGLTSDDDVSQATMTILTSPGLMDENSFANPEMVTLSLITRNLFF